MTKRFPTPALDRRVTGPPAARTLLTTADPVQRDREEGQMLGQQMSGENGEGE